MKIVTKNGKELTVPMNKLQSGETFRYIGGSNIYMMTDYRASGGWRLIVNLNSGSTGHEELKQVVPITDIYVVIEDPMMTVTSNSL